MLHLLLVLFACEPDPCLPHPGLAPELELGTGERGFVPLGDTLDLVHGPQGGYHVLIGLRARYLSPEGVPGAHLVGEIEGAVAADTLPWLSLRCNPETDSLDAWNQFLIFDAEWTPETLDGHPLHITATITDIEGNEATDTADVLIHDPTL